MGQAYQNHWQKWLMTTARNIIVFCLLAFGAISCGTQFSTVSELESRSFTIDLPKYTLRFSLPEQVVQQMHPQLIEKRLDFLDQAFFRDGIRDLARHFHHFDGPFWVGINGWFDFSLSVVRPLRDYTGDITTLDGLDSYIRWWTGKENPNYGFQFDRCQLGGRIWLRRSKNTLSQPHSADGHDKIDVQIICVPLDKDMFFQASFSITESVPGTMKKWKAQAEAYREVIRSSLILEPKK